jgi:hypothetical protein
MTAQQDQENVISTPDGSIEETADTQAGHAFWRRAGVSGVAGAGPGGAEVEPDDADAESDDTTAGARAMHPEPDEADAEADETEAERADDRAEPDDDIIVAEPDDIVVAEVIDEEPGQPSRAAHPAQVGDSPGAGIASPAPEQPAAGTELSQQWRDIQATFVDDPRDAVRLAAEAAEAAVNGVIDVLRSRREALGAAAGDSAEHRDTEQLRGELRQYRALCQNLEEIGRRLARRQPA